MDTNNFFRKNNEEIEITVGTIYIFKIIIQMHQLLLYIVKTIKHDVIFALLIFVTKLVCLMFSHSKFRSYQKTLKIVRICSNKQALF